MGMRDEGEHLDRLIDEAEERLDQEDASGALDLARSASALAQEVEDEEALADLAVIEAGALALLGDPRAGLARLESALERNRDDLRLLVERGMMLYELCRFDEARAQLLEAVATGCDDAWAHHTLGLIAEHAGDDDEADLRFAAARRVSPDEFGEPARLSHGAFDDTVEEALAALPEQVRKYLANVAVVVEDLPADEDLLGSEPPLPPSILGMFRGAPLGEKASMDPWSHFPSSIVLYQRNLERLGRDRARIVEEIRITLLHEVGHFLGLDERDLRERGLD